MKVPVKPLVSVIVPAYNHEKYVEKTILSIVNQTYGYENIELIVIDDCSTDKTAEILNNLSEKYHFLFIKNSENKGVVKNVNSLIKLCKGKYIAGCASDDYWHYEKLDKQVNLMENLGEEYAVCHSKAYIIDENENFLFFQDRGIDFHGNIMPKILIDNRIVAPTTLIRKSVYDKVGLYDENIKSEDREMWIRISSNGFKFYYIDEALVYRRQHKENLSRNIMNFYNMYSYIFDKYRLFYQQYKLEDAFHYIMFTHISGYSIPLSFKHLKKIKNKKILLKINTLRTIFKYLIPKYLLFSNFGLKIKRIIKSW